MQLETNPATQLQMQWANSKNRTIRIIAIRIVFHYGELVTISQSEAIEASGVSIACHLIHVFSKVSNISAHIRYKYTALGMNNGTSSSLCSCLSKANLFCKTTFLICICSALRAEIAFWESCKACWVKLVRVSTLYSIISVVPREGVNILKYRPCPMRFKVWQISSLLWKLWKY